MELILELITKYLPLLLTVAAGIGLTKLLASGLRNLWIKIKGDAAKTPTKVDDVLVQLVNGHVMQVIEHIEKGNVDDAKKVLAVLQALLPAPAKK